MKIQHFIQKEDIEDGDEVLVLYKIVNDKLKYVAVNLTGYKDTNGSVIKRLQEAINRA